VGPSVSPLSAMSPGDPVIASQSPPLDRSTSADLFPMHDHSAMSDDGMVLSEMYSKQSLSLPVPSPRIDTPPQEMDISKQFQFPSTVDPTNISSEDAGM